MYVQYVSQQSQRNFKIKTKIHIICIHIYKTSTDFKTTKQMNEHKFPTISLVNISMEWVGEGRGCQML